MVSQADAGTSQVAPNRLPIAEVGVKSPMVVPRHRENTVAAVAPAAGTLPPVAVDTLVVALDTAGVVVVAPAVAAEAAVVAVVEAAGPVPAIAKLA